MHIHLKISIDSSLILAHPQLKIGLIHYNNIVVSDSPQMIKGRVQLYQENLFFEMQESSLSERPGIAEWRKLWQTLGANPNQQPHAAEQLMKRIENQNYISPVHSAIDLNNFFSLQYEIPIGIYDFAKLQGDLEIALGDETVSYNGLDGESISLKNILYSKDSIGAFGSPFVDSTRAAVTDKTTEALQIFYLRPSLDDNQCLALLAAAGKMFTQVNGGEFSVKMLTENSPSIHF